MSLPIYNYLIYKGKSTRDFGVGISGPGVWNAPERDIEPIAIPGRDGDLLIDNGRYRNIEVTYPAYIARGFNEKFDDFRDFMYSEPNYYKLQDTYHPEEFRIGILRSGVEAEPGTRNLSGRFNMVFDCKPQRFRVRGFQPQLFIPFIQGNVSGSVFTPVAAEEQGLESGDYISTPWMRDTISGQGISVNAKITITKPAGAYVAGINYTGTDAPANEIIALPEAAGTYTKNITSDYAEWSWRFFVQKTKGLTITITIEDKFGYYQNDFYTLGVLTARFDYDFLLMQLANNVMETAPFAEDDNLPNVPFVCAGRGLNVLPIVYLHGLKAAGSVFVNTGNLYPFRYAFSRINPYNYTPDGAVRLMIDFESQNVAFQREIVYDKASIPMNNYVSLSQWSDLRWVVQAYQMQSVKNIIPEMPKLKDGLNMSMQYLSNDTPFSYGVIFTREWSI